jgi:hypothetical protein
MAGKLRVLFLPGDVRNAHNAPAGAIAAAMNKPLVITVSGAHSGVGKTRLVEWLLPFLRAATAVKMHCEDDAPATRHEEASPGDAASKDTGRYLAAGAERAFLLTGPPREVLGLARGLLDESGSEVVIFEADSLAAELAPDVAFFVEGTGQWKPGAQERRRRAHIVIASTLEERSDDRTGQDCTGS